MRPIQTAGPDLSSLMVDQSCSPESRPAANMPAGNVLHDPICRELDQTIADLGQASIEAYMDGDKDGARELLQRQQAARLSRTPQHQAAMWAAIDRRIAAADERTV